MDYYTQNALWAGTHYSCSTDIPATTFLANSSGWNIGTLTAPRFGALDTNTEYPRSGDWQTTPIATLNSGSGEGNAMFVLGPFNGQFEAGKWQITQSVKANTAGTVGDGGFVYRFYKGSDPTGSNATLITASYISSSTVINLTNATHQRCTASVNPGAVNLNNEYIFVATQWRITGAGGATGDDVNLYLGITGSVIRTPNFTETTSSTSEARQAWKGQFGFFF